jgi:hypothetical protein
LSNPLRCYLVWLCGGSQGALQTIRKSTTPRDFLVLNSERGRITKSRVGVTSTKAILQKCTECRGARPDDGTTIIQPAREGSIHNLKARLHYHVNICTRRVSRITFQRKGRAKNGKRNTGVPPFIHQSIQQGEEKDQEASLKKRQLHSITSPPPILNY